MAGQRGKSALEIAVESGKYLERLYGGDSEPVFSPRIAIPKDPSMAETMYDRVARSIKEFEEGLKPDEEVGATLAQFGPGVTISVDDVGFHNPYLMKIYGTTSEGHRCELLQHVSQTNLMLVALKVTGRKPKRIGFKLVDEADED